MELAAEAQQIRTQISRRVGRRFTKTLAARVRAHVEARRGAGESMKSIGRDLGLSLDTLYRWRRDAPAFRAVEVVAPPTARGLTVHGPRGLRIEGLDLAAIAELWGRLG